MKFIEAANVYRDALSRALHAAYGPTDTLPIFLGELGDGATGATDMDTSGDDGKASAAFTDEWYHRTCADLAEHEVVMVDDSQDPALVERAVITRIDNLWPNESVRMAIVLRITLLPYVDLLPTDHHLHVP